MENLYKVSRYALDYTERKLVCKARGKYLLTWLKIKNIGKCTQSVYECWNFQAVVPPLLKLISSDTNNFKQIKNGYEYFLCHSYNKRQRDALLFSFVVVKNFTCFGQIYCPSSEALILYSQKLLFVILVILTVCWRGHPDLASRQSI